MTHREFLEWLRRVERSHPVLDWRIGGIQVWPMIRLMIYGSNFHARTEGYTLGIGAAGYARVATQAGVRWAGALLGDAAGNAPLTAVAEAVFLAYSVGRQPMIEGRRFNPLLAPYVELLAERGLRSTVWEMSPFGDYNVPRYTPSHFVQPRMIWSRLRSQLARPRLPATLEGYDALCAEVAGAGLAFPYAVGERFQRDVWFVKQLATSFGRWLDRVRPRLAFVADASLRDMALCLACRERGITSVEIQHGVQGAVHPTYAGWTVVPAGGYQLKPNAWWCWDAASAEVINAWASLSGGVHEAVVGGDPWRQMWRGAGAGAARGALQSAAERVRARGGERHVLVTLSSNREILPPVALDAIRRSPPGWRWWFRMHPVNQGARRAETESVLRALGQDVSDLAFATEVPLPALLRQMQGHMTMGLSTVVQEALEAGVPSVGWMEEIADFYAAEVAARWVRVAGSGEGLVAALTDLMNGGRRAPEVASPDPGAAMDRLLARSARP